MSHQASRQPDHLRHAVRGLLRRPPVALAMLGLPGLALAGPTGEDVIRGEADVVRPNANNTVIDQHTTRAVINWDSFSVDADEYVLFNQPGASSIVLNRVLGGDMSRILGQIDANGQVFLLNPNGVFFAEGASLDVQGFLGSTLDMDPDGFMSGDYTLTRNPDAPANASVINDGQMSAGPGGYVVLAGDYTENTGIIAANAGTVALVSGNALTLDIEGDGLVNFAVDEATLSENAGVRNTGSLIADGGRVIMTAKVASDLVTTAVNNEGLVRARSVEERGGEIYLVGRGGDVANSGTLDADGENADGGGIGIYSDRDVTLANGGVQTAAGDENHEGGVIRAIAKEHLDYQRDNLIRVTGGTSGGFVEVSGHGSINLRGTPQIGSGGSLLIDPTSMTIVTGSAGLANTPSSVGVDFIQGQLDANVSVAIVASNTIDASSGVSAINATGTGNLLLGIGTISGGSTASCAPHFGVCVGSDPASLFTPSPGGNISLSGFDISMAGDVDMVAQEGNITVGDVTTTAGSITVDGNNFTANSLSAGNDISVTAVTGGAFAGEINITGLGVAAGGNVTLTAGAASYGGNINLNGGISAGGLASLTASGGGLSSGGRISIGNGILADTISISASGPDGQILLENTFGTALQATNNISLSAIGTNFNGGRIEIGAGTPESSFTGHDVVSTNGNISISATGPSNQNGGVIVAGNIDAGGSVNLAASGGGSGGGHIHLGDYSLGVLTAPANISANDQVTVAISGGVDARLDAADISGGGISITVDAINAVEAGSASVLVNNLTATAGNISIGAFAASTATARVDVGTMNATGSIDVRAIGDSVGGNGDGQITLAGTADAGGHLFLEADGGAFGHTIHLGGDLIAGGDIAFGSAGNPGGNVVNFTAGPHSLDAGGNITLLNLGLTGSYSSANYLAGGDVAISTRNFQANSISAGGAVTVDAFGLPGTPYVINSVTGSHINMHFGSSDGGGSATVDIGSLTANGSALGNRDVLVAIDGAGMNFEGNLTVGNATAENGDVSLTVLEGYFGSTSAGSVNVTGTIDAARRIHLRAPDAVMTGALNAGNVVEIVTAMSNIETGAINVSNASRTAAVVLDAGTDVSGANITVNGDITAHGRATSGNPLGAVVDLRTANGNINVTGNIDVAAAGRNFSDSGMDSAGFQGIGLVRIDASSGGMIDIAHIGIDAVGTGNVQIWGNDVSVGNIALDIADGNATQAFSDSSCEVTCSLSGTQSFSGARAGVFIGTPGGGGASLTFGDVSMSAGNGYFEAADFADITGGGITMDMRGMDYSVASSGTYDGAAVNFAETGSGGAAIAEILASSAGSVTLGGPVSLNARGLAELRVNADVISLRDVSVDGSAGTFERTGEAVPFAGGRGPFDRSGGGPRIDEGTIVGGNAHISLGNFGSGSGSIMPASSITAGALSAAAEGSAGVEIYAGDITVGAVTVTGGHARQDGTFSHTYFDSGAGSSVTEAGSVVSSYGEAGLHIQGSGNVRTGNITLTGPAAGGSVYGQNVRTGGISITGSGGDLVVDSTRTWDNGDSEDFRFDGPGMISGFELNAHNAVNAGNISVDAVGAGGLLLAGATIDTRNIRISVTDGGYSVLAPEFFGSTVNDFTAGDAMLGIYDAVGEINGNVTITASQGAHYGGTANVSGDFTINAGTGFTNAIPANVRFLDVLNNDGGGAIALPAAMNVNAANIQVDTTNGSLNLNGANLDASSAMEISAGRNISISGVTFDARRLVMTAGGSIRNSSPASSIRAGAAALSAGNTIDLSNTVLRVGSRRITGLDGDTRFLDLMRAEGVATPSGGPNLSISARNVLLGGLNFAGDYLALQANTLTLTGAISTSDPDLLVQLAPLAPGATFSLEQRSPGAGDTQYVYDNALAEFGAATLALGTTAHTGDVSIGGNSEIVDIDDTNLFVLSNGTVTGLEKVLSTGIVKDLATLLGLGFSTPQTSEIDANQDPVLGLNDDYTLEGGGGDEEEEGDEEGEDTDTDTDVEDDDDSLIRQETADEEMMCS